MNMANDLIYFMQCVTTQAAPHKHSLSPESALALASQGGRGYRAAKPKT